MRRNFDVARSFSFAAVQQLEEDIANFTDAYAIEVQQLKDKTALLAFSYYSLGLEEERVGESERASGCYKRSLELLNDCD